MQIKQKKIPDLTINIYSAILLRILFLFCFLFNKIPCKNKFSNIIKFKLIE